MRRQTLPKGMSWKNKADKSDNRIVVTHNDDRLKKVQGVASRRSKIVKTLDEAYIAKAELIKEADEYVRGIRKVSTRSKKGSGLTLGRFVAETCTSPLHRGGWEGTKGARTAIMNAQASLEFFGKDAPLSSLDEKSLEEYQDYLLYDVRNSPATVNKKLSALSKVLSYAEKNCSGYSKPTFPSRLKENKHRIRYLRVDPLSCLDEEKSIIGYFTNSGDVDALDVTIVLLDTGMRPNELWSLDISDIDLNKKHITIHGQDAQGTKNGEFRGVPMTDRVCKIFSRRIHSHRDHLFPFNVFWYERKWSRMKSAIGYDEDREFIPYCLRHTCATRLLQSTGNLVTVQKWMGHKAIQTTLRYAHLDPNCLSDARDSLEKKSDEKTVEQKIIDLLGEKLGLSPVELLESLSTR